MELIHYSAKEAASAPTLPQARPTLPSAYHLLPRCDIHASTSHANAAQMCACVRLEGYGEVRKPIKLSWSGHTLTTLAPMIGEKNAFASTSDLSRTA